MSFDNFITYGRIIVNWKLQNFSKDLLDSSVIAHLPPLFSPDFKIVLSNSFSTRWKLLASRNKSELTLYLKRSTDDLARRAFSSLGHFTVKYEVNIKDHVNNKCIKRTHGKVEVRHFEEKLGKIINLRECSRQRSYRFVFNGTIHIVVFLEILRKEMDIVNALNSTLSSHYEKMFNNASFSDFTITTSDGKEIHVHKNILSMRSPVFEAMINSSMKEGAEKNVLIDDIEGRTLMELIRFVYSGKVNEIDQIAAELLYAANKYDIQDLKPLCVDSLASNITINNALETLVLAELHQEKFLKKFCMDYIKWKYDEIKENTGWVNFTHDIMKEILDFVMSPIEVKNEESTIITNIKRSQVVNTNNI